MTNKYEETVMRKQTCTYICLLINTSPKHTGMNLGAPGG